MEEKYKVDTKYNLKFIWKYLKKHKFYVTLIFLIILFAELSSLYDTILLKILIDRATESTLTLYFLGLMLGIYFLIKGVIGGFLWFKKVSFINKVETQIMNTLEKKAFNHITGLSYLFHTNKKSGSMISQFTRGINKTESILDELFFNVMSVFWRIILSISIIFIFDITTSIIVLITILIFLIFGVWMTNLQRKPQSDVNYREDMLKQNLADVFTNIETVKYFGKERRTQRFFASLSEILKNTRKHSWDYFCWFDSGTTVILVLGTIGILYSTFSSYLQGGMTIGSITLIYGSVWKLWPNLFRLVHGYRHFIIANVDVSPFYKMFLEKNDVVDIKEARGLRVRRGKIKFENVSFQYPGKIGKDVLKEFTLDIHENTKVALVGPSGSGKTTVIRLLYRLFDINRGKIYIDEMDISKVTQESLRNNMSIVPQEPILFDNTIFFNVAYANPKASKEDVWKAIKFAKLDRFISTLPRKEKTLVGERGVKLSGGEKQRVSIARAILANKKILVLDEATSALDSETEKEIQNSLDKLMENRTSIIIAHRLSTIMKADIIVVMQNGKIVEIGSHEGLKRLRGGLYQRLWNLQQGGNL